MGDIKAFLKENKEQLAAFGIIASALIIIMTAILSWNLPAMGVSIFVLLEAGLAICLQKMPVWLHGAILIVQLIAGLLLGNGIFLLLCALYYAGSVLILHILCK